jgi:hypothetical protein
VPCRKQGQDLKKPENQLVFRLFLRYRADSNRCIRFCRPPPSHSATVPYLKWDCKSKQFFVFISKIILAFFGQGHHLLQTVGTQTPFISLVQHLPYRFRYIHRKTPAFATFSTAKGSSATGTDFQFGQHLEFFHLSDFSPTDTPLPVTVIFFNFGDLAGRCFRVAKSRYKFNGEKRDSRTQLS